MDWVQSISIKAFASDTKTQERFQVIKLEYWSEWFIIKYKN